LIRPIIVEEVEFAIKEMKTKTTPGPNDFLVISYKKFWGILMEDFYMGALNPSRINYGIIILLLKLNEVVHIVCTIIQLHSENKPGWS
jgi:hypothetical protein